MRAIKYRELKQMYDLSGPEKTVRHLQEALEQGHLQPEDFSIRELAEATLSSERVRQMDPRNGGAALLEAGEAVDVTAFSNITGQVIRSKILEAYEQEAFVVSKLVDTIPTRLDGERIPGIGRISDEVAEVRPGMPYPNLGFGEDYIDTPQTTKRGFIVPVTKEAIFFDRTHLILQRAAEVGEVLGPEQGEAADRPVDRRDEQLQVEGRRLQHLQQHGHGRGARRHRGSTQMTRNCSIGPTSTRPSSSSPTSSIRTRASRC